MSAKAIKIQDKIPSQRRCLSKTCKKKFTPARNNQFVCDWKCANDYTNQLNAKKAKAEKAEGYERLKTHSDYSKELQIEINTIARLIDKGSVCVSSLKPLNDKFDCGHRFSCGAFPQIRFNLLNCHAQSVHENQYKSGNPDGYDHGLSTLYGEDYLNEVHELKLKYPTLKLSITELIETKTKAKKIVSELKKLDLIYPPTIRVILRKKFNERLGIYK